MLRIYMRNELRTVLPIIHTCEIILTLLYNLFQITVLENFPLKKMPKVWITLHATLLTWVHPGPAPIPYIVFPNYPWYTDGSRDIYVISGKLRYPQRNGEMEWGPHHSWRRVFRIPNPFIKSGFLFFSYVRSLT